jgi:hypothetical protein
VLLHVTRIISAGWCAEWLLGGAWLQSRNFQRYKVRWNRGWIVGQMNIPMLKIHYPCGPSNCFVSIFWPECLVFVHNSYYTEVAEWNKINSSRWNAEFMQLATEIFILKQALSCTQHKFGRSARYMKDGKLDSLFAYCMMNAIVCFPLHDSSCAKGSGTCEYSNICAVSPHLYARKNTVVFILISHLSPGFSAINISWLWKEHLGFNPLWAQHLSLSVYNTHLVLWFTQFPTQWLPWYHTTCNAHAPCWHPLSAPLYNVFPHCLINGTIFEKKKYWI